MINYLLGWPCGCCDDWKDISENSIVLRSGQHICQSCYDRKLKTQKLAARRKRAKISVSDQTVLQTLPH
ncbi:hypothetical protein [Microcoleus anatoxicus]|uniref:hypothetical protein n=1 Tax=Microcoleus anatoxicus TaxID=2705319 RepID=UPI0030C9E95E